MNPELRDRLKSITVLLALVRFGRRCFATCLYPYWRLGRFFAIRRYFRRHKARRLHLGSGQNLLEDWLNTDACPWKAGVVYVNAAVAFPFPANSFDYVYSEHLLEHMDLGRGRSMISECFRVLRPGGRLRISTPSLEALFGLLSDSPTEMQRRYLEFTTKHLIHYTDEIRESIVINNAFREWGHRFLYDEKTLRCVLEEAGFTSLRSCRRGETADPVFAGVEGHGSLVGDVESYWYETMVLEAQKPVEGREPLTLDDRSRSSNPARGTGSSSQID